jgi:hypothetical protein
MAEEVKDMSESEKKKEDWMNSKWRPMMGWMYMAVCTSDFIIFPILWSLVQVIGGGRVETQWSPITLQGAGLFHMAMGAILGIAAYGRTQEKLNGASTATTSVSTPSYTPPAAPAYTPPAVSTAAPKPYVAPTPVATPAPAVSLSSSGKAMPAPQVDEPL